MMTDTTTELSRRYLAMLEAVSQCARAARDGDWHYLAVGADALERAAAALGGSAAAAVRGGPTGEEMLAVVSQDGSPSEAAKALHPPTKSRALHRAGF